MNDLQRNKKKLLLVLLIVCISALSAQENPILVDLGKYRYSLDEMQKIANDDLLPHRIFYEKPSQGSDSLWFDAVKEGNLEQIRMMLENGQDIEAKDEASLGQTALGWASFIGYPDIVRFLVEKGADIRATDRADVYHTVKAATLGGNVEVLEYLHGLLKDEVDWDAREEDGETLLMVAAVDGRYEALEYILQFNPTSINAVSEKYDCSALSGACERGFHDVVYLLIQYGAINHKTGKPICE